MPTYGTVVCVWLEQSLRKASPTKRKQILKAASPVDLRDDIEVIGNIWFRNELRQLDRYKHPLIKVLINNAGDDEEWDDNDRGEYINILNLYS